MLISPILKTLDYIFCTSYCPISLLPRGPKVLEGIIYYCSFQFFFSCFFSKPLQSGLCTCYPINYLPMVQVPNDLRDAKSNANFQSSQVQLIRSIDTTDHVLLRDTLPSLGFQDSILLAFLLLHWMPLLHLHCGFLVFAQPVNTEVLQSSVLGVLFFLFPLLVTSYSLIPTICQCPQVSLSILDFSAGLQMHESSLLLVISTCICNTHFI